VPRSDARQQTIIPVKGAQTTAAECARSASDRGGDLLLLSFSRGRASAILLNKCRSIAECDGEMHILHSRFLTGEADLTALQQQIQSENAPVP